MNPHYRGTVGYGYRSCSLTGKDNGLFRTQIHLVIDKGKKFPFHIAIQTLSAK